MDINNLKISSLKIESKWFLPLAFLYFTISVSAATVAYKFVEIGPIIIPGATLLFPLTYLLGDAITEVYGYEISIILTWSTLICELIFAYLVKFVISLPVTTQHSFQFQGQFINVLGSINTFVISGFVADVVSEFLNSFLISRFKVLMKGRFFCIRSFCASLFTQLIQAFIIFFFAFRGKSNVFYTIMFSAYLTEILYSIVFIIPTYYLVLFLKKHDGYDVYDYNVNYNPFVFFFGKKRVDKFSKLIGVFKK